MPTGHRGPRDPNRSNEAGRVLRFTVTTTLLALGAQGCHRSTGHVYVNEGPSPTPPETSGGAGDAGTPPAEGDDGATTPPTDGDGPTATGPTITPIGDPPAPKGDPSKPVVMVNPGPTTPPKPQPPEKPKVIVNPGPTTTPPGTPRP
ncbi:MAG: hypothetical protein K1X88_17585 [Nannocystaceae bacterium]|nr:hypothetical protein [Nannocystaceae bacterium]